MVPILLLFAAMFIMLATLGSFFIMHLRDHEREQVEAEDFAQRLLRRFDEMIEEKLSEIEEEP